MLTPLKICLPQRLTPQAALKFSLELKSQNGFKVLVLDFKDTDWLEPFSMLYVTGILTDYRVRLNVNVVVQNFSHLNYGKHMGFFNACGANIGKKPGQAKGSDTYLPISEIHFHTEVSIANKIPVVVQDVLDEKAKTLAEILLGEHANSNLIDVVSYSFREIARNVYEHSGADRLSYVAQYWPATSEVEICISDLGCGLYSSITKNPYLVPKNNADAINMCLLPGISCKGNVFKGQNAGHWDNSGFGLFMMASLCSLDGSIFILSKNDGLLIRDRKRHKVETFFNGTLVRVRINTGQVGKMSDMARSFVEDGRKIAKELTGLKNVTASDASGMITRHFIR